MVPPQKLVLVPGDTIRNNTVTVFIKVYEDTGDYDFKLKLIWHFKQNRISTLGYKLLSTDQQCY